MDTTTNATAATPAAPQLPAAQVVAGTRANPGAVLASFPLAATYACGGANTAALREWSRLAYTRGKRNSTAVFFRTVGL